MKKLSILPRTIWIILSMLFTPLGLAAAPANDNLAAALNIETLPYTHQQDTSGASNEAAEIRPQCLNEAGASVWYQYTATDNQTLVFDSFGSDYDTVLSVWSGTTHPLTAVACNDDNNNRSQSQLIVETEENTTYYINISGYNGETGSVVLNAKQANPLTNDNLADAIEITLDAGLSSYRNTQLTQGATNEPDERVSDCNEKNSASVWYQYTPTTDQRAVFDTAGSDYNTVLSIWEGDQHPLTEEVLCNDDNSGPQSQVGVELAAGTTYYINISAAETGGGSLLEETGLLVLNLTLPPTNDYLANAIEIEEPLPYTNTQNTGGATIEIDELFPSCVPDAGASVWYFLKPSTDYNNVTFSTAGSGYDTVLSIWQGTEHPLTELENACNDNAIVTEQSLSSQITIPLTENLTYYIDVGGVDNGTGHLILRIEEGETDFTLASQPQDKSIEECQTATLVVNLNNRDGEAIEITDDPIGSQWETNIALPFIYQWYQGESGDDSTLIADIENNPVFITKPLRETTQYWVRITNPTGTIDSETVTVTVAENTSNNGTGVDAEGNSLSTEAHFVGLVTNSLGGDENVPVVSQDDTVFVTFTIKVDTNHIGQPADIFTVGKYTTADDIIHYFMRNGDEWISWDRKNIADLAIADQQETLLGCINIPVFDGHLKNMPGDFTAYVGYRLSNGELYFNGEPVINFTVE